MAYVRKVDTILVGLVGGIYTLDTGVSTGLEMGLDSEIVSILKRATYGHGEECVIFLDRVGIVHAMR